MNDKQLGYIFMGLTSFIWGIGYTAIKICMNVFDPLSLGLARFIFASILFIPVLVKYWKKIEKNDLLVIILMTLIGLTIYQFFYNAGASDISAGLASILISTEPIFIYLISIVVFKERLSILKISGILISFFGIVFIFYSGSGEITKIIAIIFILIASVLWSLYTIISKFILYKYDPYLIISIVTIFGAISLMPILPTMSTEIIKMNTIETFSLIFLVIFATFLAPIFNFKGLKLLSATNAGVFYYLQPVFTVLSAYFLINEPLTLTIIIGGILVISGVVLVSYKG
ncbi:MAG: DMT family transporter [Thermoplasmata archaeon]